MKKKLVEILLLNENTSKHTSNQHIYNIINNFYPIQFENVNEIEDGFI